MAGKIDHEVTLAERNPAAGRPEAMACGLPGDGVDLPFIATYDILKDIVRKHRDNFGPVSLGGNLIIVRVVTWDRDALHPVQTFVVRCSVCGEDLWVCDSKSIGFRGTNWIRSEIDRVYNEERLNKTHRHDGSKVKSAGKQ